MESGNDTASEHLSIEKNQTSGPNYYQTRVKIKIVVLLTYIRGGEIKFLKQKNRIGFTLIEIIIDISIIALVALGVLSAYSASFKGMELAKAKTASVALANEKMEDIHNMPYDSLATEHGLILPAGALKDNEEFVRRGVRFNVHSVISYVDDPFDGCADVHQDGIPDSECLKNMPAGKPRDLYPYDYKKIEITVSKIGMRGYLSRLTTNIGAKAAETSSNTGIIKLCIVDSLNIPVAGALVTIENSKVSPAVNIGPAETGLDGCIMVPNLPPDSHNHYHLTATKDGYSTDLTWPRTPQNPNEQYQDIDIIVLQVQIKTMVIDKLSTMEINFVDSAGNPVSNIAFHMDDSKEIYFNPSTYKYSKDLTTDANGYIKLTDMEFGDYKITTGSGTIAATSPFQPIGLKANTDLKVRVQMAATPTQPVIYTFAPPSGKVNDTVYATMTGKNFDRLVSVKLVNSSGAEIVAANINVIRDDTIEADFNLQNAAIGLWDIVVTNPNGESTRQLNGFEVKNE